MVLSWNCLFWCIRISQYCIVQNIISRVVIGSIFWYSAQWLSNVMIVLFPPTISLARRHHPHLRSSGWDFLYVLQHHQCPQESSQDFWGQRFKPYQMQECPHDHQAITFICGSLDEVGTFPDETYGYILCGFAKSSKKLCKAVFYHLLMEELVYHFSLCSPNATSI